MSALWVGYPKSYTKGRARPVQYVVLHYTAGSEGPKSAEAGALYDKARQDGTSTHYFTDSDGPALQEVPEGDRSHTALFHGNEIGIHIEICGTRQTREQWLDAMSLATLRTTAALVREICDRQGLAKRRLTTAEVRAAYYAPVGQRPTGITDHAGCTYAYPEDGGDHTDVGDGFPWDVLMEMVTEGDDEMRVWFAQDDKTKKFYLCNDAGAVCREITPADMPNINQLAKEGLYTLVQSTMVGWFPLSVGSQRFQVRSGWYEGAYGKPVETASAGVDPVLVPHTHAAGATGPAVPTP